MAAKFEVRAKLMNVMKRTNLNMLTTKYRSVYSMFPCGVASEKISSDGSLSPETKKTTNALTYSTN